MRFRNLVIDLIVTAALLSFISSVKAQAAPTSEEKQEVESFARSFIERLQETKDIAPLVNEFFAPDFLDSIPANLCAENVAVSICSQISREERLRAYVATYNLIYFNSLDILSQPDEASRDPYVVPAYKQARKTFEGMLPSEIATKLRRTPLIGNGERVNTVERFRNELSSLEQALSRARDHLLKNPIEIEPQYRERVAVIDKEMGYIVHVWTGEYVRDDFSDAGLAANERLFRVQTPRILELLLVRSGGGLKILTLMPADD